MSIIYTGGNDDFAIKGDGFFVVGNAEGEERLFTRVGNFTIADNAYLVTQCGKYVLEYVPENEGFEPMSHHVNPNNYPFWIAQFEQPEKLIRVGGGFFEQTEDSGEPLIEKSEGIVIQALETEVNLAEEFDCSVRTIRSDLRILREHNAVKPLNKGFWKAS